MLVHSQIRGSMELHRRIACCTCSWVCVVVYLGALAPSEASSDHEPPIAVASDGKHSAVAAPGSFGWLLQPVTRDDFFSKYWEQQPLHVSRPWGNIYSEELATNLSNVHALLAVQNVVEFEPLLLLPDSNPPRSQANCELVKKSMANENVERVYKDTHFAYLDGATVVCHIVAGYWPPLAKLMSKLQDSTGYSWGSNLYLSPRGTQGFTAHTDNKNGFILQVEGRKRWIMHNSSFPLPMRDQQSGRPWDKMKVDSIQRELIYNGTLEPGDVLYVPRGIIHSAESLGDGPSMHFTISTVKNPEWADFLTSYLKHFAGVGLDLADVPKIPGQDKIAVLKAVTQNLQGMFLQALANERMAAKNHFLRASVPALGPDNLGSSRAEDVLLQLDRTLEKFKVAMKARLKDFIAQGKISGEVLEATFVALQDTSKAKSNKRRHKALAGAVKEDIIYTDYVNNLNKAGISRPAPCETLAKKEISWDFPVSEEPLAVLVQDLQLQEEVVSEYPGEQNVELSWLVHADEQRKSLRVRSTSVLLKSMRTLLAASKSGAPLRVGDVAGQDLFEKLSFLTMLRANGIVPNWGSPDTCTANLSP